MWTDFSRIAEISRQVEPKEQGSDGSSEIKEESDNDLRTHKDHASTENKSKKRKRDTTQTSELEIDVSLPEPPSKKALRKAKRQKNASSISAGAKDEDKADSSSLIKTEEITNPADEASKRTPYGVWVGNLPFTVNKSMLRDFLTGQGSIPDTSITRIHIPAPADAKATHTTLKPKNKGFAYVDFDSFETQQTALGLTETKLGDRKLLIKDAKSFAGRPEKPATEKNGRQQPEKWENASRRVWVGNLAFDIGQEDLRQHFAQCGSIEKIHVATFEDSGKCKGFAWVTFEDVEAAKSAVKGWVFKTKPDEENQPNGGADGSNGGRKSKRKWFVNRLYGRDLRCQFAEDDTTRYKKRFASSKGGEKPHSDRHDENANRSRRVVVEEDSGPLINDQENRGSFKAYTHGGESGYRTGKLTVKPQGKKTVFE